jgi:hypothetical protein
MNTTKITLKSAIPMAQAPSTSMVDKRTANDTSLSASLNKPTMSSRQKVQISTSGINTEPGARCKVSSLTPYGEKLDALAARALPELLGVGEGTANGAGSITRDLLDQAIASPFSAKNIRALPSAWPTELISDGMVTAWTSRLVAACDHVYSERGMQAYIEAMTDLIFDEGNLEGGLPSGIRDFCAMLTKNALEVGVAQGLDRRALQGLRNTVIIRFLMGNVFVPHLRPTVMRESTNDAMLYAFDRQLFKGFCHKTTEIIDIDAEAIALLAAARQTKKQSIA